MTSKAIGRVYLVNGSPYYVIEGDRVQILRKGYNVYERGVVAKLSAKTITVQTMNGDRRVKPEDLALWNNRSTYFPYYTINNTVKEQVS